jgi:hypothetical protein
MKAARLEYQKSKPSTKFLNQLLKETFPNRHLERTRINDQGEPMVSTLLTDWGCLELGEHVRTLVVFFFSFASQSGIVCFEKLCRKIYRLPISIH